MIIFIDNIINGVNNNINLYWNKKEEEKFYNDIKDKLLYFILTKKGIIRKMFSKEYKNNYKLNTEQREVLIGIMLGDGFLERVKSSYNTRLRVEQSYPEKEEYLLSLFEIFKPMVTNYPKIITRKADKRTGKVYKSLAFKTSALNCLNEYHNLFYNNKIKIVPKNIKEFLTARGLAYWIMDDGGKGSGGQTILHTRGFTKNEVIILQDTLKCNFCLITSIQEKTKNQWIIIINKKQVKLLNEIIQPYMHKSMSYKM